MSREHLTLTPTHGRVVGLHPSYRLISNRTSGVHNNKTLINLFFLNPVFNAGNYGLPFNSQPQVVAPAQMNRAYNGPQQPNYVQPGCNSWVNQPWYNPQSTQPVIPQQVMHPGNHQVLHQMNPQFLQPQVHLRQPIAPQSYANNTYFNQPASVPQPGLLQQPVVMEADQDVTVDLGGLVLSDE